MKLLARNAQAVFVAVATAMVFSGTALADGKGLMLGGGLYYANVSGKLDGGSGIDDIKFDDSSGAYNLDIGWRFNKWIAVDAGYWGLGEYKADDNVLGEDFKTDTSAWTVGGIFSVPIWIIDIYARGGAAWWEANTKGIDNDDGTDPYYGLGAAFNLGGSLDIYGEWTRFDLNTDIDLFGVGVRWTF